MRCPTSSIVSACLALLVGCTTARRGEPITGSVPANNQQLMAGRVAFMRHCHECHPNGEGGLGPALNNKPAPRFLIKTQVRTGLGSMPEFNNEKISNRELDALVDYMVALRRTSPID